MLIKRQNKSNHRDIFFAHAHFICEMFEKASTDKAFHWNIPGTIRHTAESNMHFFSDAVHQNFTYCPIYIDINHLKMFSN